MTPAAQAQCLDALTESGRELTCTVLGGFAFEALGGCEDFGAGNGAYLGLVAQAEPVQVGILVDGGGCQLLSKTLLGKAARGRTRNGVASSRAGQTPAKEQSA